MPRNRRRLIAAVAALATAAVTLSLASSPAAADPVSADRPDPTPLPADLETIRAAEAEELYGSPDIKPIDERKSSLITMGDSQISGEGVGNYDPDTHRDGNWCDRSYDQAVFRTGIDSDVQYNVACSGGQSKHLIAGNGEHQWDELNQGDNLAIKARNTKIKLVWIITGANDSGGIEFGPTATECATNRILFQGPCYPKHTDDWAARVEVSQASVEEGIESVKQTMTDAGYLAADYELVLMSYASPGGPDVEDNPDFPGWYRGGCLLYLHDAAFARNKAVPLLELGIREAAANTGVRYLNAGRLFDGHGVCEDNTWARGIYVEVGELPSENAFRQSLHPNARGHGAFAQCMTRMYENPDWRNATCVDPASTGSASLYQGLFEFADLKNGDSGLCVDAKGYDSRDGTALQAYDCHGGRNQGFYYDEGLGSLHVELSHDRCVDSADGTVGAKLTLRDCDGGTNQKFTVDGDGVHPKGEPSRCLSFDGDGTEAALVLDECGTAASDFALTGRDYADPVGYGHDDFIGASVY